MIKYRTYNQSQELLLPPNLEEFIGDKDLVRVVDHVVDKIDHMAKRKELDLPDVETVTADAIYGTEHGNKKISAKRKGKDNSRIGYYLYGLQYKKNGNSTVKYV